MKVTVQQPADPVARVAVEASVSASDYEDLAAAVRKISPPPPIYHDWGYECPGCGRQWVGRQGFRLSAARSHIGACVPPTPEQQDLIRRYKIAHELPVAR